MRNIRKSVLIVTLLFATRIYGQATILLTGSGGTTGGALTSANLLTGTVGCLTGVATNQGTAASPVYTYGSTGQVPTFPFPTNICGTINQNTPNKPFILQTNSSPTQQFNITFPSTAKASVGLYYCADYDAVGGSSFSASGPNLSGNANDANILLRTDGLQLESNSGFTQSGYAYHGGTCSTDPTAYVWVTISRVTGSPQKMSIYKVNADLSIGPLLKTFTGVNSTGNATLFIVGKTGAETEPTGQHFYFGGILIDPVNGQFPLLPATLLSNGIIATNRATDWTKAGVVGGIPSATWTQCGGTISPFSGSAAAINTAISGCTANQFVLLGPGTFTLSSGISFGAKSNVALRGSGANSTFLNFSSGASAGCSSGSIFGAICAGSNSAFPPPSTVYNWTAGYAQGTGIVTLSSVTGIVAGQTILVLSQCPDGQSGNPCTGTQTDTGNFYNCDAVFAVIPSGCAFNGPDAGNGWSGHFEQEMILVTAINGLNVTLEHGLRNPNWAAARTPVAWFWQPSSFVGIENLSINTTSDPTPVTAIKLNQVINSWVSGVRVVNAPAFGVYCIMCVHNTFRDSYLFGSQSLSGVPHAINITMGGDDLIQNNIIQAYLTPIHMEGPSNGSVIGYNFLVNDLTGADNLGPGMRPHTDGNNFLLFEGNVSPTLYVDQNHGTQNMDTVYRNFLLGWESCANGNCGASIKDNQTNAVNVDTFNRYHHLVGNVLGVPTFHTTYLTNGFEPNKVVLAIGSGCPTCSPAVPTDSLVQSTMLLWGNYDVVTATVRWCGNSSDTGWATTCSSTSEVPTTASVFPNPVPTIGDTGIGQSAMPASFYLKSKPTWFQSLTWPPIGPDVTSGNIGQCLGTLNVAAQFNGLPALTNAQCGNHGITASAWGGHLNANPAMNCALVIMGMPPDGTGSVLPFDAKVCYSASSLAPPTNLHVVPLNKLGD